MYTPPAGRTSWPPLPEALLSCSRQGLSSRPNSSGRTTDRSRVPPPPGSPPARAALSHGPSCHLSLRPCRPSLTLFSKFFHLTASRHQPASWDVFSEFRAELGIGLPVHLPPTDLLLANLVTAHTCTHAPAHTCTHRCMCAHMHRPCTHMHTVQVYRCTQMHMCAHAHMHTAHKHVHTSRMHCTLHMCA